MRSTHRVTLGELSLISGRLYPRRDSKRDRVGTGDVVTFPVASVPTRVPSFREDGVARPRPSSLQGLVAYEILAGSSG